MGAAQGRGGAVLPGCHQVHVLIRQHHRAAANGPAALCWGNHSGLVCRHWLLHPALPVQSRWGSQKMQASIDCSAFSQLVKLLLLREVVRPGDCMTIQAACLVSKASCSDTRIPCAAQDLQGVRRSAISRQVWYYAHSKTCCV